MRINDALDKFYYSAALCDLRLMNREQQKGSLSFNGMLYLDIIFFMHGKCTVSKLAELLHVSKPGVTQKINELIRQGLVIKTVDAGDRRRNYLAINEEAAPQYKVYRHQDAAAIEEIAAKYSAEDMEKFCEMLDIVSKNNFEEITTEP